MAKARAGDDTASGHQEGILEKACFWLSAAALAGLVISSVSEIIARGLFHHSFGLSDEMGGYLLVAIAFLSLPFCQANHVFHNAEMVQARLSPQARRWSNIVFDGLCLAGAAILLWQTARFGWLSWSSGETSTTEWTVPLWIPRLAMPIGSAVLCYTLIKVIVHRARHRPRPERVE